MTFKSYSLALFGLAASTASLAGVANQPLGTALGASLGTAIESVVGRPVAIDALVNGGALLGVVVLSLLVGVHIVRAKRR